MINAKGDVAKRCTQLCTQHAEEGGPPSIIGNYFNSLPATGTLRYFGWSEISLKSCPPLSGAVQPHPRRVSQFLVSIVYCECFAGGPNNKESWTGWDEPAQTTGSRSLGRLASSQQGGLYRRRLASLCGRKSALEIIGGYSVF